MVRPVVLRVWHPDQQHQQHLGICFKCKFSGPTTSLMSQRLWGWVQQSVFDQVLQATGVHPRAWSDESAPSIAQHGSPCPPTPSSDSFSDYKQEKVIGLTESSIPEVNFLSNFSILCWGILALKELVSAPKEEVNQSPLNLIFSP